MLEERAASIFQGPDLSSHHCVTHMNKKSTFEGTEKNGEKWKRLSYRFGINADGL